jgi:RNA polymerase sigma factor (TIGR02999 family)
MLQATALVHETYLRLVDVEQAQHWNSRGHFFAAAAEAMRRILIESARRKKRLKHGGGRQRQELPDDVAIVPEPDDDLIALDAALSRFAVKYPLQARLVELRYFAGLTGDEAAAVLLIDSWLPSRPAARADQAALPDGTVEPARRPVAAGDAARGEAPVT